MNILFAVVIISILNVIISNKWKNYLESRNLNDKIEKKNNTLRESERAKKKKRMKSNASA